MKPQLKTAVLHIEYWDCGNPDHRHPSEHAAKTCIKKCQKEFDYHAGKPKWTDKKLTEILTAHKAGARKCDLAKELGLSPTRIQQILNQAERLERKYQGQPDKFSTLSSRTRNSLLSAELDSVEKVKAAIANGKIDDVPNIGGITKSEIVRWLIGVTANDQPPA